MDIDLNFTNAAGRRDDNVAVLFRQDVVGREDAPATARRPLRQAQHGWAQPLVLPADDADQPHLRLQVSLNEEHVTCTIGIGHAVFADLGERGHHYCLLTLARLRMDDARRGLDASSQGWIGNAALATMLGLDVAHLNIQVHRLRRQILKSLPPGVDAFEVIERRRGELRFGTLAVSVVRGSAHEGSYWPQRAA